MFSQSCPAFPNSHWAFPAKGLSNRLPARYATEWSSRLRSDGDASMGQQLAQKWCNNCHAVGAKDAEAYGSVPSFVLIAEMCFNIGGRRLAQAVSRHK